MFTGEDPEVRFVDLLPTLTRASQWNDLTPEESHAACWSPTRTRSAGMGTVGRQQSIGCPGFLPHNAERC